MNQMWQYYRVILKEVAGNVHIPGYSLYYVDVFYSFQRPVTQHNSLAYTSFRNPHSFFSLLSISPRISSHSLAFLQPSHLLLHFLSSSPLPYNINKTRQSMAPSSRRRGAHTISGPCQPLTLAQGWMRPAAVMVLPKLDFWMRILPVTSAISGVFGQTSCSSNTTCPLLSPTSSSSPKFRFQIVLLLIVSPSPTISFSHTSVLKVEKLLTVTPAHILQD